MRTRSAGGSRTIEDPELTPADRAGLLRLARDTLEAHLAGYRLPAIPDVRGAALKRGAFVTIIEHGSLRGCIGHVADDRPLGEVVRDMTLAAARDDPRFPPVTPDELPGLAVEISVLTPPAALQPPPVDPRRIVVGRDGLIVRRGRAVGLLLPQVATEYHWGPDAFLAATCRKAGLPAGAWREPDTEVLAFQADVFGEPGTGSRQHPEGMATRVLPRIAQTSITALELPSDTVSPRRVAPEVLASVLPGPGRDRLAQGEVLTVTTGQQPGLFAGPLYTVYKALSAIALAWRLERQRGGPVVPVFWVAGDDHDFAEANHVWVLDAGGELVQIVLRERPAGAPLVPLAREPCGEEIRDALARLRAVLPDTEFKDGVLAWLERSYRPDVTLADAFADALNALLGPRGLAVLRAHDRGAKQVAAPWVLKGLAVTLHDGYTPVLVEASQGRDRVRADGAAFVTRRSGERFTRADFERIALEAPERLSPNVLLRPVIEAALLPTVAYAAGPAELAYLPEAAPLYEALGGVPRQAAVPRWSGVIVEGRVEKLMERHGLDLTAFDGKPGELEARLVRQDLPPETIATLAALRNDLATHYGRLLESVTRIDPTLGRTVESARNAALSSTQAIEKKLVASLKRLEGETLVRQIGRARAAVYPRGQPQERVLTLASFTIRYGPELLDALAREVARWAEAS